MYSPIRHLYIHVPFCPSKCSYCAFVTHIGSLKLVPAYLDALEIDLEREVAVHPGGPLDTVYLGGGTPSMLAPADIARLLGHVGKVCGIADGAEITLECHPATVDERKLTGFKDAGVTRLSFGVESLHAGELDMVARGYTPERVREVIGWSRSAGFSSIALDLIYGLPEQTAASWQESLKGTLELGVDHLSLYPLSIEPRSIFARREREGTLNLPTEDDVIEMYHLACRELASASFIHYEVANWARAGWECRHNTAYWLNREFYAIGTGAHGYIRPDRTERRVGVKRYIDAIAAGVDPVIEREEIDEETRRAETTVLRLRLLQRGLVLSDLRGEFGFDLLKERGSAIDRLQERGLVRLSSERLFLPEGSVPLGNEVFCALM